MSLSVWLPGPMFLRRGSLSLSKGLYLGGLHSGGSLSRGSLSKVSLSRRFSVQGSPSRGLCPGGSLSRGSLSSGFSVQGSLSKVSLSSGVSVQGSLSGVFLCPGGSGSSLSERHPWTETPLPHRYGKERAVRILLECILDN